MLAGNPAEAARVYAEAEKLEPGSAAIRKARVNAEAKAGEVGQLAGMQKEKVDRIIEAQQALDARRWDDAAAAANAALALDPKDIVAQQMLAAAQAGLARTRAASAAPRTPKKGQPEVAAAVPVSEPAPEHVESRQPEPVAQAATLRVSVESAVGGSSVMVYMGNDKLFQQSVGDRGGLLRKGKAGRLDRSFPVQPGPASLRVYVTPPGQKSLTRSVSGSFAGGQSRLLEIRLGSDFQLEVALH
jgi:hypothetical protein